MGRVMLIPAACLATSLAAALPTQPEALARAFPGAHIVRKEHFLTEAQARIAKESSGGPLSGAWVVVYEARKEGVLQGVAYFDTHRVRTLNETAMVAVAADGTVKRVEVIAFREPPEYLAKEAWVRQLEGRKLDDQLSLKRGIRPLSGATLTANVLVEAARRCLALHRVLYLEAK